MKPRPLAGRRVLVTRAAHQASKLTDGLRALGAEPIEVPTLEIRPPASFDPLDQALRQLSTYNWLIVTSANTVQALQQRATSLGISLDSHSALQVAAIGPASAGSALKAGLNVALVPDAYVAESLVGELAAQATGKRVLLARATVARDVIPDALRAAGAFVDVVDAYSNAMPDDAPERLRAALASGIDAATFTSSSSAKHLADAACAVGLSFPFTAVAAVSIGPITTKTLCELGWPPAAEASVSDIPGLIQAVVQALQ